MRTPAPTPHDPASDQEPTAAHLREVVTRRVRAGDAPGAVWWVQRGGTVLTGSVGTHGPGHPEPVRPDTVFRISSMTKPVVASAAMTLVDDGTVRLDDPVDPVLPEVADRRVLVDPEDPSGRTVPARRPITVRDLLDFRLGLGMDFAGPWPNPFGALMADVGVPPGPPAPQAGPPPRRVDAARRQPPLAHWEGGMGSTSWTDPVTDVTAILLTNMLWASSGPPPLFGDFRAVAFDAPRCDAQIAIAARTSPSRSSPPTPVSTTRPDSMT